MPATIITPSTIASEVRTVRSLRSERLRNAIAPISRRRFIRSRTCSGLPAGRVADDPPVDEHQDPVGDRGGGGVVGDHDHGLAELVDRRPQQRRGPPRSSASRGCRSARRRRPPPARSSAPGRSRPAAAGRRRARRGGGRAGRRGRRRRPARSNRRLVGIAAGELQRQQDVLPRVEDRQQVEELEDEADVVAAQLGELAVVELAEVDAVDRSPCPRSGGRGRRGMCIRVDLPEPDGPMIAVRPPAGKSTRDAVERA